jgi:hypothetical protein
MSDLVCTQQLTDELAESLAWHLQTDMATWLPSTMLLPFQPNRADQGKETDHGIRLLQDGRIAAASLPAILGQLQILSMSRDHDGNAWVGTNHGIVRIDPSGNVSLEQVDLKSGHDVTAIYEDFEGEVWFGGSRGLERFLSSGHIKVPPNLPNPQLEQIFGIGEDGIGSSWFSTSDHVVRVNEQRLLDGTLSETDVQNYGSEDGLTAVGGVARDHSVVTDRGGRVWISLISGLYMADPVVTSRNAIPVTTRIESIFAGGRQFNVQSEIRIPSRVQNITVEVGGTSLAAPQRVRFRYQLNGSGQNWSDIVPTSSVLGAGIRLAQSRSQAECPAEYVTTIDGVDIDSTIRLIPCTTECQARSPAPLFASREITITRR